MERLTTKSILGGWTIQVPRQEAIDRLAEYEDTGLEPEEVKKIYGVLAEVSDRYNLQFDFVVRCLMEKAIEYHNDPLTLDELREMDGEPVWVVVENEIIMCALVETAEESVWLTNNLGGRSEYRFDEPIEDGIVIYCRKP